MRHHIFTSNEACKIPLQITLNKKQLLNVLFWPEKKHFFLTLLFFLLSLIFTFLKNPQIIDNFQKKKKLWIFFFFFFFFFLKDNFDSIKNFWWILQICIPFYHHPLSLDRISLFCYKMVKNLCLRLWIVVSKLQSSKNWWEKNRKIWTFAVKNF